MICKKCAKKKHYKCKNGAWKRGTRCDCQHRVKIPNGYALYLANKFGLPIPTDGWQTDEIKDDAPWNSIIQQIVIKDELG